MVHQHLNVSDEWTIVHNLGASTLLVSCRVDVDGVSTKILPVASNPIDENTVRISFSRPYCGEADIVRQKCWSHKQ